MDVKGLYKLNKEDQETLVQTFKDAFVFYPKMMIAFPQKEVQQAALEATLRYYIAFDMEYGAAFSLDPQINEGVCVVHSDNMDCTLERFQAAGSYSPEYQAAMNRMTEQDQKKWKALYAELDRLEDEIELPFPHLYADFLGVATAFQKQGRGRRLMNIICDYAKEQGLPIMLFTNTEEDIAFYKSLGFSVVGVAQSDTFGFTNTYMVKEV